MTSFLFKTTITDVLKQIENPNKPYSISSRVWLALRGQMMTSYLAFVGESALFRIIFHT